jgi:hypothetical protein
MLDTFMSVPVILISTALLTYWVSRTMVLLHGSQEAISKVLDNDLRRGHAVFSGLR